MRTRFLACQGPPFHCVLKLSKDRNLFFSSYKATILIDQSLTCMTSLNLNYRLKTPIFRYSHILNDLLKTPISRYSHFGGLGLQHRCLKDTIQSIAASMLSRAWGQRAQLLGITASLPAPCPALLGLGRCLSSLLSCSLVTLLLPGGLRTSETRRGSLQNTRGVKDKEHCRL